MSFFNFSQKVHTWTIFFCATFSSEMKSYSRNWKLLKMQSYCWFLVVTTEIKDNVFTCWQLCMAFLYFLLIHATDLAQIFTVSFSSCMMVDHTKHEDCLWRFLSALPILCISMELAIMAEFTRLITHSYLLILFMSAVTPPAPPSLPTR